MNGIKCSVHFLTLNQTGYEELNSAVTFYHDRTHFDAKQRNQYAQYAENFSLQQGRQFVLHNRIAATPNKMTKIKDQVKQLDLILEKSNGLAKILWLSSSRLLLITHDAVLVWLLIDSSSGDLIKILIDNKSLINLSGITVCDAALVIRTDPTLILAYSDKSVIDLISLEKTFIDHMRTWTYSQHLEKLSLFHPNITSFEFSCPNTYSIQKHISLNSHNDEFFTIWWPNYQQVPKINRTKDNNFPSLDQEKSHKKQILSHFAREDLKKNVILLRMITNKHSIKYLENVFKSDGLLLSCSYLSPTSLVVVEQTEISNLKYVITIYRYDLPEHRQDQSLNTLKIKLTSLSLSTPIFSTEQIKPSNKYIIMLNTDQTIVLYKKNQNSISKHKMTSSESFFSFDGIEWVVEDLIFCVYCSTNGQLCLFDIAFNQLNLKYHTRAQHGLKSLSDYLNPKILTTSNKLMNLVSARSVSKGQLWIVFNYSNGPLGLLKLCLPDRFNCVQLASFYIKNSQLDAAKKYIWLGNAVKLLQTLNWNQEASECMACLLRILSYMLSVELNLNTELLAEDALGSFYRPAFKLTEKTVNENKYQVSRWARKYFYKLLKNGRINKAFLLTVDIGAKDLLNDLYYCALDRMDDQVAEVCRKKYCEILSDHKIQLKSNLNRSVTKDEDNHSQVEISFCDRYSVSSSESDSVESDYQDSVSKLSSDELKAKMDPKPGELENSGLNVLSEEDVQEYAKNVVSQNKLVDHLDL